ncbi:hypothetical protein CRENBAI_013966 [Crenichthys baileyi]|uniref:Uncharacterized protein n=1 Tax=Crenichthys baileyi TaxID=28760 RepID=A0AAV9RFC9_9TELE
MCQYPEDQYVVYSTIGCQVTECRQCCSLLWLRGAWCRLALVKNFANINTMCNKTDTNSGENTLYNTFCHIVM